MSDPIRDARDGVDRDLIKRAQNGDADAFAALYEKYYKKIFKYVYYRVTDTELAEDLTADVFVKMVRKIDTYTYRGKPFLAWLYTIAGNLVRDYHRRNGRIDWLPIDERELVGDDDPASAVDLRLSGDMLARAIGELTDDQAQVIVHKFVEGLSNAETAQRMDKNEGSIKSLQHRALRALRKILTESRYDVPKNTAD